MNIKNFIKLFLPETVLFYYRNKPSVLEKAYTDWINAGKPVPPHHIVKQKAILEYKEKFNLDTLVETGTFRGDMMYCMKGEFKKLYSIELAEGLYKKAKKRFKKYPNVNILFGDSGEVLKSLVPSFQLPVLFWLDGHYSGTVTAKGNVETPILMELETIFKSNIDHTILVDDAILFNGTRDYPTMEVLKNYVAKNKPQYKVKVENDLIRISK
ncbi:MAG: hypothetical protein Q8903_02905 [Bacteroidota bacterium]|nr:hypothetical protein [Bacteroidota bacterium]